MANLILLLSPSHLQRTSVRHAENGLVSRVVDKPFACGPVVFRVGDILATGTGRREREVKYIVPRESFLNKLPI